jgi:hypothetical protein
MRIIGIITTAVVGLVALVGITVGLRSVDDFKRYLRIRGM